MKKNVFIFLIYETAWLVLQHNICKSGHLLVHISLKVASDRYHWFVYGCFSIALNPLSTRYDGKTVKKVSLSKLRDIRLLLAKIRSYLLKEGYIKLVIFQIKRFLLKFFIYLWISANVSRTHAWVFILSILKSTTHVIDEFAQMLRNYTYTCIWYLQ